MKTLFKYIYESVNSNNELIKTLCANKRESHIFASESLYQEALEKFGEGTEVLAVAYTDYGGDILQRVIIEFYKNNYPEMIVWEETSYNGQNAICLPVSGFETNDYFYNVEGLENEYYDLEFLLIDECATAFCKEHNCKDRKDEVFDWLMDYGHVYPTFIDYYEENLIKFLELEE